MAIDWAAIENVIHTQVALAAGVTGSLVLWEDQDRDRPVVSFLSMEIRNTASNATGNAERSVTDNPTPTAGAEILLNTIKQVEFEVIVSAFTRATTGGGGAYGWLSNLRTALESESAEDAFFSAGLALYEVGAVLSIPRVLETQSEGRGTLALKFRTADVHTATATFIETIEWTGTVTT
jgi:hypothetical protein